MQILPYTEVTIILSKTSELKAKTVIDPTVSRVSIPNYIGN